MEEIQQSIVQIKGMEQFMDSELFFTLIATKVLRLTVGDAFIEVRDMQRGGEGEVVFYENRSATERLRNGLEYTAVQLAEQSRGLKKEDLS